MKMCHVKSSNKTIFKLLVHGLILDVDLLTFFILSSKTNVWDFKIWAEITI